MMFCVIHLDPPCAEPDDEEVYVIVPGAAKTAIAVPLDGLPQFLPLLEQAVRDLTPPQCPVCSATMPGRVLCASPQSEPP